MPSHFPDWLHKPLPTGPQVRQTEGILETNDLHTVCDSALCPNRGECFSAGTATFLILGDCCTRNCTFCAVPKGTPLLPDPEEPERLAQAAFDLGLQHVVVTSVTRDDLTDGGASHFAAVVHALHRRLPEATVEVLTPDFQGRETSIDIVLAAHPEVFNHNIETVARLYPVVRPQADYKRSLALLRRVKEGDPTVLTKSGLMVGLGETSEEVLEVLADLRQVDCDALTIGQYLRPSPRHLPVERFVPPAEFQAWKESALTMGFRHVESGPFVRSSYKARAQWTPPS